MNTRAGNNTSQSSKPSITVYADFNCPYCHALNERLEIETDEADITWLPVEHAPDLFSHSFSDLDSQELAREVSDVQHKAPDILLRLPPARPNTRLASLLYTTVIQQQSGKAASLRTAIYRALWHDGKDISDADILAGILADIGLGAVETAPGSEQLLQQWYSQWQNGQFAQNIPAMESSIGFKILGLPHRAQLQQFIDEGFTLVGDFQDAACVSVERYRVHIVSGGNDSWPQPTSLQAITRYHYHDGTKALREAASREDRPDMILLNNPGQSAIDDIRQIKQSDLLRDVPVMLLTDNEDQLLDAYRSGVTDVTRHRIDQEILGHRMVRILRTRRNAEKMFEIARIDALTGLYNRREFDATIEREWRQYLREKNALSLLMIDLDYFKAYNDTYGHNTGDEALRRFARILESCASRPVDLAVRYGGEEFALILPNVDLEGAKHVAELVRKQTRIHDIEHSASPICHHLTVSIGVASAGPLVPDITAFVDQADKALYQAKKNGRDRVCVAP